MEVEYFKKLSIGGNAKIEKPQEMPEISLQVYFRLVLEDKPEIAGTPQSPDISNMGKSSEYSKNLLLGAGISLRLFEPLYAFVKSLFAS